MNRVVVLGAGTAGTMVVNKLRPLLDEREWEISIVDQNHDHHYQPGYLFIPFGIYQPSQVIKPKEKFIPKGVEFVQAGVEIVEPESNVVRLSDGTAIEYDYLVIATGTTPRPEETPGMMGTEWRESVFDFYTLEGATALAEKLRTWDEGRLVVHIAEMPIKCPVAPLEFAFLADSYFKDRRIRDQVDLTFVTPLDAAFTKPVAARQLGGMLDERKIALEADFY
ncbi:MAG: FAD/NAD(P)-binding oxidoreductase, partial [Acidimicrobiia bacterium]